MVLILPKMRRYVRTFTDKDNDKDNKMSGSVETFKDNKLTSFHIDDDNLLEKYRTIWTKIKDLQNAELNALIVDDERYIQNKIKTYVDKIYTNFHGLDVSKDDIECKCFTLIYINYLTDYENKNYLQVYLDEYSYRILDR